MDHAPLDASSNAPLDAPFDASFDAHFDEAYTELLRIAHAQFSRASGTLDTVALVSEAYLRMHRADLFAWKDGQHVRAVACRAMRQIVCNHLRGKQRDKRGGARERVTLSRIEDPQPFRPEDVLDLDAALERLEAESPRHAEVVEMRCFGGFTLDEIAETLGVNVRTVKRDWHAAALFLRRALAEA